MIGAWLARLSLSRPLVVLGLVGAFTIFALVGTFRLESRSFLEGHLPKGDYELDRYEQLTNNFGGDRLAVFAIGCGAPRRCDDLFEPEVVALIRELDDVALGYPGVEEVQSLATAGILVGSGFSLDLKTLGEEPGPAEIADFRGLVLRDPILLASLVSEDLRTTAMVVRFDTRVSDRDCNASALSMYERLTEIATSAGFDLYASGVVLLAASAERDVRRDLATLTPVMLLLLSALLIWIFRDARAVWLALVVVALPATWAFGLMGWTGSPITPVSSTMPILILVVGITDAVHFLVRAHDLRTTRESMRDVVLEVAREVGPPTTVTAATSALGFLSFLAGPMPNLRDFGLFSSVGIVGGWLLTFTLIPIALASFRIVTRIAEPPAFVLGDSVLGAIHSVAHRRAPFVLAVAAIVSVISIAGITRIVPSTSGWKVRGGDDPFVRSEEFLKRRLLPTGSLEVVYQVPESKTLYEPGTLAQLKTIERSIQAISPGKPVLSVLQALRIANREISGGHPVLPATPGQTAQLLLLLESADSRGVRRTLTLDHATARVTIPYETESTLSIKADQARLSRILDERLDGNETWFVTGVSVVLAHMADVILENQISSFSAAFVTIFLVILVFVRSVGLGSLGMIPNLFPVAAVLGFMGFASINLDVATAMIASILIGVSVDDTAYFLIHYQKARRRGDGVRDAVAFTFAVAGKPALFCSLVLSLGFFVLAFSSFQSLAIFGLLSGVAVLLAVVAELFIMPAILELAVGRRR